MDRYSERHFNCFYVRFSIETSHNATANNKDDIEPLFDRFGRYFLSEHTDEESKQSQYRDSDKREGIENEELAL
ncbi:MAG: hypothetical protein WAZ77_18435 [Candidatus Nitrosopolaris sp.]